MAIVRNHRANVSQEKEHVMKQVLYIIFIRSISCLVTITMTTETKIASVTIFTNNNNRSERFSLSTIHCIVARSLPGIKIPICPIIDWHSWLTHHPMKMPLLNASLWRVFSFSQFGQRFIAILAKQMTVRFDSQSLHVNNVTRVFVCATSMENCGITTVTVLRVVGALKGILPDSN